MSTNEKQPELIIIGGGLAGSEAAWQAAERGIRVKLFEMRPGKTTGAHTSDRFAELVCSNSLGSKLPDRASGMLKEEIRIMGSLLLQIAEETALPAGGALAVDREEFADRVTKKIEGHPNIQIVRQEACEIPSEPTIIASGPLTSAALAESIRAFCGNETLYFYDAIAPIVTRESIDFTIAFKGSRYGRGEQEQGDYINCPCTKEEYETFWKALIEAERIQLRDFESEIAKGVQAGAGPYFEGCLPVEVIARRGERALTFGPMRPVGLRDPRTGQRPYAIVQLRQDNLAGSLYNLVGFQTNLTFLEQKRVFRMIPGLGQAEFMRYGQMHRNTFIASPYVLEPSLRAKKRPNLFFAGQITGVEGYLGNIATGLLAGVNAARELTGEKPFVLPKVSMLGALCDYITHAEVDHFQPMKANFGILPGVENLGKMSKRDRYNAYSHSGTQAIEELWKKE
jgi:methylenetetrahydrofolate--tRNA-(uracil-5-)-methyltransferase